MRGVKRITRRAIRPDAHYHSVVVAQFINKLMLSGKKETAQRMTYRAIAMLEDATKQKGLQAFETALNNISPTVEVRSKRIGGATYQVPMEVRPERKMALAMRWIIQAAQDRHGKSLDQLLLSELLDAYNNIGSAMKKRDDLHKMAEANKAFAHFARF